MQNFILVLLLAVYPVRKFSDQFLYSNHNNVDVFIYSMVAIAVLYFVIKNITSAVGISVLIASAVTAFGVYYGTLPNTTWFGASLFLLVWVLIPTNILPGFVRMVPRIAGLAFSKKSHS